MVLVENAAQREKILKVRAQLPHLKRIVLMSGEIAPSDDPSTLSWEAFLALGDAIPEQRLDERVAGLNAEDMATLIYTSGTTGPPKAVVLNHRNLTAVIDGAARTVGLGPDERLISYLPLSHIAEQMFSLHAPAAFGYTIYFAQALEKLREHLPEVHPTVFFGVPRVWEKIHAAMSEKLRLAPALRRAIAGFAQSVGREVNALRNRGAEPGLWLGIKYAIANKLVFSKAKAALGFDQARVLVSGAAPIGREVIEFFAGFDLVIHEIYGQSEDGGPTTFNFPGATKFGSVGKPIPGCDVRLADDGEILVRGDNVFVGYLHDPKATAETLKDGWLHSGDLGRFDEEGYLYIVGRKKEIIITSGGKNIAPRNIEEYIEEHPLVALTMVVGDRRNYLAALVTLKPDAAAAWVAERGGDPKAPHRNPELIAEIQRHIQEQVNPRFAQVEWVRRFRVLPREFSMDLGELTPTLKLKRKETAKVWANLIEGMYAEGAPDAAAAD